MFRIRVDSLNCNFRNYKFIFDRIYINENSRFVYTKTMFSLFKIYIFFFYIIFIRCILIILFFEYFVYYIKILKSLIRNLFSNNIFIVLFNSIIEIIYLNVLNTNIKYETNYFS